ncbi:helix-turn-helix domain-containing protein [Chryseobacterium nakagawai]|uniref:helix-turn-helix domain-containing protein n=1 Tax=Chryseobacterium nakagawai TaxID=1241982 RepID=UPI0013DE02A7|nr:AraC family transcriptional regulator [Chryseobacterium nakagawai]
MKIKKDQIHRLKLELMDRYVILMISILGVYSIIFIFFIPDKILSWYLPAGILFLGSGYSFARKRFSPNLIVNTYLILAPIFGFYLMLAFWENSVASFSWLLPIPLGAYIFFSKKGTIKYVAYTLIIIITASITADNLKYAFPKHTQREVMFTDINLFISNILVVSLLIYYKDKIKKQEILEHADSPPLPKAKPYEPKSATDIADIEGMEKLFERIEKAMNQEMLFKDVKLNLSRLSVVLDVNSSYISKAIRYKGHSNFNIYLNTYRINYVKKLLEEIDFQKTTLMYVYTEAGFSNQSTFNRVFKQIEGITPSEYIQQNLKIDDN